MNGRLSAFFIITYTFAAQHGDGCSKVKKKARQKKTPAGQYAPIISENADGEGK
jgi:hypothetical protein